MGTSINRIQDSLGESRWSRYKNKFDGLNEEIGRRMSTNDDRQCKLYGYECESVYVLWECPVEYNGRIRICWVGVLRVLVTQ